MSERPRWRPLLRPARRLGAEVDDELRFHLEARVDDLVARGLTPDAARARAAREFGDVGAVRTACLTIDQRRERRDTRVEVFRHMTQDVTFAARALRRSPGFALAAILCLALGIGVTTTIFSAVWAILVRPLPYPEPDRLVAVYGQNAARGYHATNISYPDYASWRDQSRSFDALGIWTWTSVAFSGDGVEAERVEGASVAASLFPLLGVRPILGRGFLPEEERIGREHVILLGYDLWRRRWGGDPAIVGHTVMVSGAPYVVVGVMPPEFRFPDRGDAWIPFATDVAQEAHGNRGYAGAIGRLRRGVTLAQAREDLASVSARLAREFPRDNVGWAAELITLRQDLTGDLRAPLLVFLGAVGFVLLIACANVANLMLARATTRQRELAIRAAVGAGRGRLARQILTESLLIATVGGAVGVALSVVGVRLLRLLFPESVPFYFHLALDVPALAFAVALIVVTALLFGAAPAFRATAVDLVTTLREGTLGSGEGRRRSRLRSALVVGEVALSLVLLVGATLLVRSYRALEGTNLGFDERGVLTLRVSLPEGKYREPARRLAFYEQLFDRLRALPGVDVVGSAQGIPFSGWDVQSELRIQGKPVARPGDELIAHYQYVTPDFFRAMGIPLLRGRALGAADRDPAAPSVVVNQQLVERAFPGDDPIGKRIKLGDVDSPDPWATIVGVVRDFRHYRLPQPMGPAVYFPYASYPLLSQTLAVRTRAADPLSLVPAVRAAIKQLDADVPAYQVQTMAEAVGRSLWRQRAQGAVLALFALLALLLAAVGLYGVISYGVAQRTREIGVRVALGASRGAVQGLVLRHGARLAIAGVALGLVASLALTRVLASLLYGVTPIDGPTFVGVPVALILVALLASWIPARRATRVDPLIAMRAE